MMIKKQIDYVNIIVSISPEILAFQNLGIL